MKRIVLKQFCTEQSGSILMLVGLSLLFLFGIAGAGYDLGRQQLVRQKIQQAADASALAGASLPIGATTAQRTAEANMYFSLNYPATYLGVPRPSPTIVVNAGDVKVTASASLTTNFVSNLGITTMTSAGLSQVQIASTASSDYDVVMVVDESGSECRDTVTTNFGPGCINGIMTSPVGSREAAQQAALRTMADTIVPVGTTNQNVRMGFIGFSGRITNKWGLSYLNADAKTAINNMRPVNQNYDHVGMMAAQQMLLGGTGGVPNARIGGGLGDGTVAYNITQPVPRTARTNTSDANGIAPTKYVVFISDGGIMIEPGNFNGTYFGYFYGPGSLFWDYSGLVASHCPGMRPTGSNQCFSAFIDACNQLRNTGGTDNVHLFFINLQTDVTVELPTLTTCASPTVPGGPVYTPAEKPNPAKDFFFATSPAELASILTNITSTIQKQRIIQ